MIKITGGQLADTIIVTENELIEEGDKAEFFTAYGLFEDYGLIPNKTYHGVITKDGIGIPSVVLINDYGKEISYRKDIHVSIEVTLTPSVYKYRVMEQHTKAVALLQKKYDTGLEQLKEQCAMKLTRLIKTN